MNTETTMSPAEVQLIREQLAAWKMVAWQAQAERDAENIRADTLAAERDSLNAARIAYASEFDPDAEGLPSVGSIHENIRKLKAERDSLAERVKALEEGGHKPFTAIKIVKSHADVSGDDVDARAEARNV